MLCDNYIFKSFSKIHFFSSNWQGFKTKHPENHARGITEEQTVWYWKKKNLSKYVNLNVLRLTAERQ